MKRSKSVVYLLNTISFIFKEHSPELQGGKRVKSPFTQDKVEEEIVECSDEEEALNWKPKVRKNSQSGIPLYQYDYKKS